MRRLPGIQGFPSSMPAGRRLRGGWARHHREPRGAVLRYDLIQRFEDNEAAWNVMFAMLVASRRVEGTAGQAEPGHVQVREAEQGTGETSLRWETGDGRLQQLL